MKDKIINILKTLAKERPVFHSEADFQFALAWAIQKEYRKAKLRLEFPFRTGKEAKYLDIRVEYPRENFWAIELKYLTAEAHTPPPDKEFCLKEQGAQNENRYRFVKDIKRLEDWKDADRKKHKGGIALLLTNDSKISDPNRRQNKKTQDENFRIHQGVEPLSGERKWKPRKKKKGFEDLKLTGEYHINWEHYSKPNLNKNNIFQFLLVEV